MNAYIWNLRKVVQMNLFAKAEIEIHRHTGQNVWTLGWGSGGKRWYEQIFELTYTLLYKKQITNKNLLNSTRNSSLLWQT